MDSEVTLRGMVGIILGVDPYHHTLLSIRRFHSKER